MANSSKILVVYYSRSGTTRKIAESLSQALDCDMDEIVEPNNRRGFFGYVRSLAEAVQKRRSTILPGKSNPSSYDLVIIGTPVWAWSISSPVRAYLMTSKARLPEVAFFCTFAHRGSEGAFTEMQNILGKAPCACCAVVAPAVTSGIYGPSLAEFLKSMERSNIINHAETTSIDHSAPKRPTA